MEKKKIFILVDYRNTFYSSTREVAGSMNVRKISELFEKKGYVVEIERVSDIDFRSEKYRGSFVLYQSSEDPDLRYKDYIEDILLGLELSGAVLIPDFHKFRAHHNKVFMEILRDVSDFPPIQNLRSRGYGTIEEMERSPERHCIPSVIKSSAGSRSDGVGVKSTYAEKLRFIRKISKSPSLTNIRRRISSIFGARGFKPISNFRRKFIIQNFIPDLSFDYKILVYGERYYVLRRENRPNDFRASGSGILSFPEILPDGLLDYTEAVFRFFDVPFISLDVATRDGEFFLLEFQFLSFGQYALERSSFFFRKHAKEWTTVVKNSDLEVRFVEAVDGYINRKYER